jgi:hypothetical protein
MRKEAVKAYSEVASSIFLERLRTEEEEEKKLNQDLRAKHRIWELPNTEQAC